VQLLAAGDALILLANLVSTDSIQRKHEYESFIYLIDPATGKARLACKHLDATRVVPPTPPAPPQNPAP
jgi:hypothetical protein